LSVKHAAWFDPGGAERGELRVEVLAGGADACVAEYRRHAPTVSPSTDIEDVRHALRDKK
jgi:hypothetical protein